MITKLIAYRCRHCNSQNIVKNDHNGSGSQQYWCKDCGKRCVLTPQRGYSEEQKEQIISDYHERPSMRGIQRIFGVSPQTLANWLKKDEQNPAIEQTLSVAEDDDVLELDEVWSFVLKKTEKRWLWTAMCRRTRQIIAYVIGDRSEATCLKLWLAIPQIYKHCQTYSDFWNAYAKVFPKETHQSVGKESGQTDHMERWNNFLRQWNARYVRKTLSFSKSDFCHELVTRLFIIRYNLSELPLTT